MRKRPVTLSPVERALIAKKWNESTWDANIHALISADVGNLVGKGGFVFFVAIALARQNCPNSPDHRIIRATMNAVYEVADTDEIDDLTRQSIVSGLHAASRIYHAATHEQIVKAACDLELKLRTGHIHMSDFDELEAA